MMFGCFAEVTIPGGLWINGTCHRHAEIRAVTGEDQVFLAGLGPAVLPACRATALLSRCVLHLGPYAEVTQEMVQDMTVGDREALLLHVRRITSGDRMDCVLICPAASCREKLDLVLSVSELLLPPYPSTEPQHEVRINGDGGEYLVCFRLPRGADQEAAAQHVAGGKPDEALAELLGRCVESIRSSSGDLCGGIPEPVISQLPEIVSEHDPQAELSIRASCPACGHEFSALLDAGSFVLNELAADLHNLLREVHWLALHYHWSEPEILALSAPRRRHYLELLSDVSSVTAGR